MRIGTRASQSTKCSCDSRIAGGMCFVPTVGLLLLMMALLSSGAFAQSPLLSAKPLAPLDQTIFVVAYPTLNLIQGITDSTSVDSELLLRIDDQPDPYVVAV